MIMSETLTVIFDGEVFRPEKPVKLPPNTRYKINLGEQSATTLDTDDGISPELAQEIEALKLLSDKALKKLAHQKLPAKDARYAESFHHKQQREGSQSITIAERTFLDDWLHRYDKHVLIRANVLHLLKQRGYDLNDFLKQP
jgi:predicted DNA-binding antitoxin AbrB/MazE fold protein